MKTLFKDTGVNATEGYTMYSESDIEFQEYQGFKALVKEFGRCISRQYVDGSNGKAISIGYVFQKREFYSDTKESFIKETWVSLYRAPVRGAYLILK